MIDNDKTLVNTIDVFRAKGFDKDFKLEGKHLICLQTKKAYAPSDMIITQSRRFEGMSNPSDMSALFALKCQDGAKGLVIASYGTYGNIKLIEFLDKAKVESDELRKVSPVL